MKIKPILVLPSLPEKIAHLQELAHNVWYAWSPDLIEALRDPHSSVRFFAAFALGNIGHLERDGIDALCRAADDEHDLVSSAAQGALEKIQWPEEREGGRAADSRYDLKERDGAIPIR